ncbi:hypothetical protein L202_00526 [Cryptococcus amylolentus CBS 6039]|uniref:Uncharacterized protein n=2 Tax=Cryptococcus amylolentus TaxID=104669 RepID=A0A1E3I8E2_9TREE|nr:hypothetical protein L202_00526 [Cryptococcus amylolentus CBS 6039]ODN84615.1 hypothetical protein L202_00526 [Cryptococcus amylolentus CBS 6039]ODO11620.1 hypothetical protein I350_00404 [Cryptococcus amylolentus CBS 6273]
MAHPLTQQPPSSLAFSFAARPSPLSYGFGHPPNPSPTPSRFAAPAFSPSRLSPQRPRDTPQTPLKRPKRQRSPSTSPPTSPSSPPSKHRSGVSAAHNAAPAMSAPVSGLEQQSSKRTKLHASQLGQHQKGGVDVGVMLATLPLSAHLPILIQLLEANPSLASSVLDMIPQQDLKSCVKELGRRFVDIERVGGSISHPSVIPGTIAEGRRWDRVANEVEVYCRTATTYINYFSTAVQISNDFQSLFSLLHPLTSQLVSILSIIPSSHVNSPLPGPAPLVLELAKFVLSTWSSWVTGLSSDVNDKGGMHPHSLVAHWAETLDKLVSTTTTSLSSSQSSRSSGSSHWSIPVPSQAASGPQESALVVSFREALSQSRDQFATQVGWLVGRPSR